jgi:hypothetical protein
VQDQSIALLSAGEFRIAESGGDTIIGFEFNGIAGIDMQIVLADVTGVTAADLVL